MDAHPRYAATVPDLLIPEQRRRALLALLEAEDIVTLRHAAEEFGVSHMTVRRDIALLEQKGQVTAVSGGVRLGGRQPPVERSERAGLEIPQKRAIAVAAADLIVNGMTVYLDAGTTCQALAVELLRRTDLTVVTNDLHSALTLIAAPAIRVIHTGGEIDRASGSSAGVLAARTVRSARYDLCVLSTGAWDLRLGVTTPALDKVEVKAAAAEVANRRILVASSSKYGASSRFAVLPLAELDTVVTDDGLDADTRQELARVGFELVCAPLGGTAQG